MSTRSTYLFGFLAVCVLLLTSIYLQFFQGIEPCPLCALQRVVFGVLGFIFLIGLFVYHTRARRFLVNLSIFLFSGLGLFLAGRQIWLQHFPPTDSNDCGASIIYMMKTFPWMQVLQKVISGTAECSQRGWEFLSLNMADWAFLWFGLFLMMAVYLLRKRK